MKGSAMKQADFSRTCQGCEYVQKGQWDKKRIFYYCAAPGPQQGYSVGIERYLPYIPAWCEKLNRMELESGEYDGARV